MTGFHKNTNPYAAPEPVEEDAPDYDLRKIAGLYNRLGWVLKWFVPLFVVCTLGFAGVIIEEWLPNIFDLFPDLFPVPIDIIFYYVLLSLLALVEFAAILLFFYSVFLIERIVVAMKFRAVALFLILLAAVYPGINIIVMILLRRRAKQILRNGGVEIINGKVNLTQIPVEEDY